MAAGFELFSLLQDATGQLCGALGLAPREARLEARLLAGLALAKDTVWLISHEREAISPQEAARFSALLGRRLAGEPLAYLRGEKEFFGRGFVVSPAVLIPRPETELLVETALEALPASDGARVLDLGTGSGVIAVTLALERPDWEVYATDLSPAALEVAQHNARRLGADRVHFARGPWWKSVEDVKFFDMVVSNPPYVAEGDPHLDVLAFEPGSALVAPDEGRADLAAIIRGAPTRLAPGGWLWMEHGYGQGAWCRQELLEAGLENVQTKLDYAGLERVSGGQKVSK